ncbi:TPA: DNA cytosine methyltransferase [Streptococcus suis]|uniref:DNA cytosine methyltransferase n=1 Tax=Streptococcus suis TaxID=1307 RepID=UPI000CF5C709|nr:DNA cytosine methyltransferase [Streptococcus suis]NQJ02893.1 DNA cytosine methyltransferase [Streptococcus suis]HEL2312768.1 DNA cytosine methyltransferase [Streptococcus suis]HEL2505296.1 DNA cytosine methyltransferase [Streptococcus suis]HEM5137902.1 DNA cytosine methyltransferase [Streptococcus suis]
MKFLDLFAGIGGFRLGMERAGHECVGFCEIDPFARKSYKAIHDTKGEFEFHDITRVTDESVRGIGRVDVVCGGFPCQAFSIAGKRAGFEDTRGTLFFEIARFASILRPKYLFLENVTGLLNHDNGNTFETILGALDDLGYDAEWQVFNSKNFGVPQNRERVFIIGHLRGAGGRAVFPFGRGDKEIGNLQGQSTNTITARYGEAQGSGSYIIEGQQPKIIQRGHGYNQGGEHDTAPTLTSNSWQENNHVKVYDFYNRKTKDEVGTLTASGHQGNTKAGTFGILDGVRIRKLTPRECWRLQGFPDWAFDKAQAVNSNSQLYKQAGNSVTVNVIEAIARKLEETDE